MQKENKEIKKLELEQVVIRPMNPGEEKQIAKIGRSAFGFFEAMFVSKPKHAMVADYQGELVGGIMYKPMTVSNGKKVIYMDIGFVHPNYHGMGIGKKLYAETFRQLWESDCDYMTAVVKDDNIGSYKPLLQNGYQRVSCNEVFKKLGLTGFLKQYMTTVWFCAGGMDFYMAERTPTQEETKHFQKLCYFFCNLIFFLPLLCVYYLESKNAEQVIAMGMAFMTVIGSIFVTRGLGALLARREWKFRFNNGGGLLMLLLGFVNSVFPMNGNWYLPHYENNEKDRKSMALTELVKWGVFLFFPFAALSGTVYGKCLSQIASVFMVYSIVPIYPFEHFGAGRIYRYNKWVWLITSVITAAVVFFADSFI